MNLHFWLGEASENLAFTFLSVALTKITLFNVCKVDSLARLLEFRDHILSLLDHIFVLLLLGLRSSGGRCSSVGHG